jgi:hypothetical protein
VRVEITVMSVVIKFVRFNIILRVEITLCVYKLHSACRNHTLLVEITLVRVEITVLSVVITFERVKITLRLEITLCV